MNSIAFLCKHRFFLIIVSFCCIFSVWNVSYASPATFGANDAMNVNPQSLQSADNDQGQWSNVSNLVSGGGFSQDDQNTQTPSDKEKSTAKTEEKGKVNTNFVSEAQFLQTQQLVIQLNKAVMQLQQQMNTNVSALKQANFSLSQRIQNLEVVARLLSAEIQTLKKSQGQSSQTPSSYSNLTGQGSKTAWLKTTYQKIYMFFAGQTMRFWIILSVFAILILLLLAFFSRPSSKKKNESNSSDETQKTEEEGEYDFMGSKDAIPAKFDLANAYIQMGNIEEAKHVLEDIINIGTDAEKQKAKELLNKIQK